MKRGLIILSIAMILLIAGCQGKTETTTGFGAFLGGTDGLIFSFVQDEPPLTVLDDNNEPFFITLELENAGEYPLQENEILTTLSGISYDAFDIEKASLTNANALEKGYLNKQTGEIVQGGVDQITYEAVYKDDLEYDLPFTIAANVCYQYQTQAVAQTCLSKQPTRRSQPTDVCIITEEKIVGNSGGPLQVTSFSERTSGQNEVTITFKVENVNLGESYPQDYLAQKDDCIADDKLRNQVHIAVASPQSIQINCPKLGGTAGNVRLINGQTTVTCRMGTANLAEATPFAGAMDIKLDYVYKDYITTELIVENAL